MRFVLLMIVLSAGILLALATRRAVTDSATPEQQRLNSKNSLPAPSRASQGPDELALARIKREHAAGRFPFLVSSLCRDFLQRYGSSPHRAEVEQILARNQEVISSEELRARDGKNERPLIKPGEAKTNR